MGVDFFCVNIIMNVAIIIPNSKESERCKNKNRVLRHYTLDWLARELNDSKSINYNVYEVRDKSVPVDTSNDDRYPYTIHTLWLDGVNDMRVLLDNVDRLIDCDVYVLLQLTQPYRRYGLLHDALHTLSAYPHHLVTSCAIVDFDAWRIIHNGNWQDHIRHASKGNRLCMYDGAIYVWCKSSGVDIVFDYDKTKKFVTNTDRLVDIDYPDQLDDFLNFAPCSDDFHLPNSPKFFLNLT